MRDMGAAQLETAGVKVHLSHKERAAVPIWRKRIILCGRRMFFFNLKLMLGSSATAPL
jgi:hypothetical protein